MLHNDYLHVARLAFRKAARRFCPRLSGRVVDIGCGDGPYRAFLTGTRAYVGLDWNTDLNPDVVGDVHNMPFGREQFDGALCTELLEHVADPQRVVVEINRVMKRGGLLYVTVPMTWGVRHEPNDRFTCYGFQQLLENSGFRVLETDRVGGLFSYFGGRLVELLVLRLVFPLCDRVRLRRARRRVAALAILSLNLLFLPFSWLDRFDDLNPIGWAVLAEKVQSAAV